MTYTNSRTLPTHRPPTHPGEMLREEFLKPAEVSLSSFALTIGVSYPRLHDVVTGKRPMTPDTALRVAQATQMPVDFWLRLQLDHDLWHMARRIPAPVKRIKPLPAFAAAR